MSVDHIERFLLENGFRGKIRKNKSIKDISWIKAGGNAEIMCFPENYEDLLTIFKTSNLHKIEMHFIGSCSNLLVRDGGLKGITIKLNSNFSNIFKIDKNTLFIGGSSLCQSVSSFAAEHKIKNLEFLSGIPGSIGGSLAMNAGACGSEMADIVVQVFAIDPLQPKIIILTNENMGFYYRGCNAADRGLMFLGAIVKGELADNKEEIYTKIELLKEKRKQSQPSGSYTCGCIFRNHETMPAWQAIRKSGCDKLTENGAFISEKHANFIENKGGASAKDIERLINRIQEKVKYELGIELITEVKIKGLHLEKD